ncbi:MAG: hypothetical protein ACOYMP_14500, partial [Nodosilinea sp.]
STLSLPPTPLPPSASLNIDALALVVEDPIIQFKDPDKTLLRQAIAHPPPIPPGPGRRNAPTGGNRHSPGERN